MNHKLTVNITTKQIYSFKVELKRIYVHYVLMNVTLFLIIYMKII